MPEGIAQLKASTHLAKTDTATLVVFDPAVLKDYVEEPCDWWTGAGDLEREAANGSLGFVNTGSDGIFNIELFISADSPPDSPLSESALRVTSGEILFGAAECLPGEGEAASEYLGRVELPSGMYRLRVFERSSRETAVPSYQFFLQPLALQ